MIRKLLARWRNVNFLQNIRIVSRFLVFSRKKKRFVNNIYSFICTSILKISRSIHRLQRESVNLYHQFQDGRSSRIGPVLLPSFHVGVALKLSVCSRIRHVGIRSGLVELSKWSFEADVHRHMAFWIPTSKVHAPPPTFHSGSYRKVGAFHVAVSCIFSWMFFRAWFSRVKKVTLRRFRCK